MGWALPCLRIWRVPRPIQSLSQTILGTLISFGLRWAHTVISAGWAVKLDMVGCSLCAEIQGFTAKRALQAGFPLLESYDRAGCDRTAGCEL
jgi:hypothetical protein